MPIINQITARWILDSRGNPTVSCKVGVQYKDSLYFGKSSVPSGASTGKYEAVELRDNGPEFSGKGVNKAVENVINVIAKEIIGKEFNSAKDLDKFVLNLEEKLEGESAEKNLIQPKSILGANAILGVSMASHRAFAKAENLKLWEYLRREYFAELAQNITMPRLMCNIFNGGAHADNNIDIQEFMIIPNSGNIEGDVRMSAEIYHTLKKVLASENQITAVGDEGGFAPNYKDTNEVLQSIEKSITNSGYSRINCDIGLDCAASEFYNKEENIYTLDGTAYSQSALNDFYSELKEKFNLLSIEDGFDEDDILGWEMMTAKIGKKTTLIGDDLFVTNPTRFKDVGLSNQIANGVLIKLNQIGSVLESCEMINLAHENNYITAISHRSGETNDDFIADLSVACNSEFIKLGAPARGERVSKYNRLLQIHEYIENQKASIEIVELGSM
jgi:enolase